MLNQTLLEQTEELLDLIANEEESDELAHAMSALREFLEGDVDGWTSHSNVELCEAVESRLEEIWELISDDEKEANNQLEDYFNDLKETIESEFQRISEEQDSFSNSYRDGCSADDEDYDDYELQQDLYCGSDEDDEFDEDYEEEEEE